mgnify:CR=1 FL=1
MGFASPNAALLLRYSCTVLNSSVQPVYSLQCTYCFHTAHLPDTILIQVVANLHQHLRLQQGAAGVTSGWH